MKYFFTFLSLLIYCTSFAQLPVSQVQQKKKAILEEFNGIHCQYCPDGHRISQEIYNNYPGQIILINIHTGSLSVPGFGEPDFRTTFGYALASQSGLSGYPAATINRQVIFGSETAMGRGQWANAVPVVLQQDAKANVALEADIDFQTREITIDVEVYYTGNATESTNYLNLVLTQGNVRGAQDGLGENISAVDDEGNYIHDHALRHMITGQWGDEITTTTAGTLVQKTYTYTIPESYASVDVDFGELEVVAFVTESHQEIINGAAYHPTISNFIKNLDAKIDRLRVPDIACDKLAAPVINLRNNGNNIMSSSQIEYAVNDGASAFFDWTGNLLPGHSEEVQLTGVSYINSGNNMATASIKTVNEEDDEEASNDSNEGSFEKLANHDATFVTLNLWTDRWASETSWNLKDSDGAILYNSQSYSDLPNDAVTERSFTFFIQRNECYYFEILDSYGDGLCSGYGNGKFELKAGGDLILEGCDFGVKSSIYFTTKPVAFEVSDLYVEELHDTNEPDPTVHNILTASSIPLTLKWYLTDLSVPAGWTEQVAVCDAIECHAEWITSYEYVVDELTGTAFDVHFINNNLTGEGDATVVVFEVGDSANSVVEVDFHVEIEQATGLLNSNVKQIAVYPNPAASLLTVSYVPTSVTDIKLYNVLGEEMMHFEVIGQNEPQLPIEGLQNGVYWIKLFDNETELHMTQSFVKQ